ncbi:hypothetical protein GA0061099_1004460 [Bradyrhizobium yuanmingense]|uniref:Helix-turn-helix domain-containing protein n=1 Tax=Bradyrhizobium yuanmingense TaxID=108015 RepID=A0A1C3VRL9_9BRAD|nr:hypothetical protein [Bradyrhizobium yuanmingense]TWI28872.1 hypothetical protein IQ15_02219 [Bradyrhizobium yuanmingense]SCB30412.1 hypothetical protein GA0061099_1004460 [Bradyrhizobium yuanmingense]
MSQKFRNSKHANDNHQEQIEPTDRLDFLNAIAMDHRILAKQSVAFRVAAIILKHRHNQTGTIVLKHRTMAEQIGCSISAVRRGADVLQQYDWFKVEPVYVGQECIANRYIPCWDQAAWLGGVWFVDTRKLNKEQWGPSSVLISPPLRNEHTPAQQGAHLCSVTSEQNSGLLSQGLQPSDLNPLCATRSGGRAESIQDLAEDDRSSSAPADILDLSACVEALEKNLPPLEPFGDFKPVSQERSRRGAIQQLKKLRRLGWSLDEIQQYLDAYGRDFERQAKTNFMRKGQCGKTLASLLTQLVDQCYPETRNTDDGEIYGWNIPERFLRKAEVAAAGANDNAAAADRNSQQANHDPARTDQLNSDAERDRANRGTQDCGDWPKPARACIRLQMVYPLYPVRNMHDEAKLIQAELKKLLGKVRYSEVEAGVLRYAEAQKGQDYRKNLKLSAFLAQGRWRDQHDQSHSRAA